MTEVLRLRESTARKQFKDLAGQANHFMLTILVGLDAVKDGSVTIDPEFSAAWNPRDHVASASRSRQFALKASLAWVIDALDAYCRTARRRPTIIATDLVRQEIDAAHSLGERLRILGRATAQEDSINQHLIQLAIVWRNRLVHTVGENELRDSTRDGLAWLREIAAKEFQGFSVDLAISHATTARPSAPTFKEVASMIRAAHRFVQEADSQLLAALDTRRYFYDALRDYVAHDVERRVQNVWGKDRVRRESTIRKIASIYGLVAVEGDLIDDGVESSELAAAAEWSPKEARANLL